MKQSERARGFFEVYKMAGYTKEQAFSGVMTVQGWFSHNNHGKTDWEKLSVELSSTEKLNVELSSTEKLNVELSSTLRQPGGSKTNPLLQDKQFIAICRDVGFDPKYQYQLMRIVIQLSPDIVKLAEKEKGFDYSNVITRPEPKEFYPEFLKKFLSKFDGYAKRVTKQDWEFEKNKLVGTKELKQVKERKEQNLAVLENALDEDEVMQDEITPRIDTMGDELEEWFDFDEED